MSDLPPDTDSGTPRWVKAFGIISLALILLFVIMLLAGGAGRHGPGRHMPASNLTERGTKSP